MEIRSLHRCELLLIDDFNEIETELNMKAKVHMCGLFFYIMLASISYSPDLSSKKNMKTNASIILTFMSDS